MELGRASLKLGRWWFYLDGDYQTIGRIPGKNSVVYALLGLVAEHHRPIGYSARLREASYNRLVRKWQRTLDQMWCHSEWLVPLEAGEALPSWNERRWRHAWVMYESRASRARARGIHVPTPDQLAIWAEPGVYGAPLPAHRRARSS